MISGFLCILYLLHYDLYHLHIYGNYSQMLSTGKKNRNLSAVNDLDITFGLMIFLPAGHTFYPLFELFSHIMTLRVPWPDQWEVTSQPMQANLSTPSPC